MPDRVLSRDRRDKTFGFSAFLDGARPEVDPRAEVILSKAA